MLGITDFNVKFLYLFVILIKFIVQSSALTVRHFRFLYRCFLFTNTLLFKPLHLDNDSRPFCPCGSDRIMSTRVVGGHDAVMGQFPYASALLPNNPAFRLSRLETQRTPYCGATLITDRHILTAAHCLRDHAASDIEVDVSDFNMRNQNGGKKLYHGVSRLIPHPSYQHPLFDNDVGIIELEKPVEFHKGVKTAWLTYPNSNISAGTTVTVYGWGRLAYLGGHPDVLQTLDLPVVDYDHCQSVFKSNITENMICAGGKENEDACIGDSGSGLTRKTDDDYVLVGVVSFGKRCALKYVPGIYTKLSNYVEWIYEKTKNSSCQPCIASTNELK